MGWAARTKYGSRVAFQLPGNLRVCEASWECRRVIEHRMKVTVSVASFHGIWQNYMGGGRGWREKKNVFFPPSPALTPHRRFEISSTN